MSDTRHCLLYGMRSIVGLILASSSTIPSSLPISMTAIQDDDEKDFSLISAQFDAKWCG